jgi:choline dehydrogenase-like flavoprotein
MTAASSGTVRIAGAAAAPAIDHRYLSDAGGHDVRVLAEGVRLAREMLATPPLARLVGRELRPGPATGDRELPDWVRRSHAHYFHPVATCRMGASPETAVVDHRGRVFGLENLYVADASVFPELPDANTNLPAAATAARIAEGIPA